MKHRIGAGVVASTLLGFAATAIAGGPLATDSRVENARASVGMPVSPADGQHEIVPVQEGPGDRAIAAPQHPPIADVPHMPMPNILEAGFGVDSSETMMFHNAETGETLELPVTKSFTEAIGGSGGQAFTGADEKMIDEWTVGGRGLGTQTLVSDGSLQGYPFRANVKLLMEFDNGSGGFDYFVCSGTMQDSGVVLTAAHCVYNRDYPAWATRIWIYPGWDGDGATGASYTEFDYWGYAIARNYIAGSAWVDSGNLDRDVAAIRVNRNESVDGGRNVGALTGTFGWAWGGSCGSIQGRTYHNASYPSQGCGTPGLHNGRDMTYWFGGIDSCPDNQMRIDTGSGCYTAMWGGQSGSGVYYIDGSNRFVHGVASTSNRSSWGEYCKLWEQFTVDLEAFKNTQRGSAFDLEALQVRTTGSTSVQAGESFGSQFTASIVNATNNNPASQNYTLRVYLSTNNNISTSDRLLATWNYNGVDFAANQTRTFNIPAPSIPLDQAPGTYYLGVIIDGPGDNNSANDDSDSWDAQRVTVLTPDAPSAPALFFPSNNSSNVSINANLDWFNSTNTLDYDVYFGTDPTPDSGEFVGNTASSAWTLPTLSYGTTYYWRVVANGPSAVTNSATWSFNTEPMPAFDLAANTVLWQNKSTYAKGETINIFHSVSNVGNISSPGFNVDMRLSNNTTISTGDWALGTTGVLPLSPGATNSGTNAYTIPLNIPDGTYYLGMIANQSGDASSANNTAVDSVQVTVVTCLADLVPNYGVIDLNDVDAFINAFLVADPSVDFVPPFGIVDLDDLDTFINAFLSSCP